MKTKTKAGRVLPHLSSRPGPRHEWMARSAAKGGGARPPRSKPELSRVA